MKNENRYCQKYAKKIQDDKYNCKKEKHKYIHNQKKCGLILKKYVKATHQNNLH